MPRLYHSPSSTELGRRCARAWAYCYLDGLRDPEVTWSEDMAAKLPPGVTPRQRSAALGGATHKVLESWYAGGPVAWLTYPGRVAESGRHLLPQPDTVLAFVESPIGDVPIPGATSGPRVGLPFGGVTWAGFRDLVAVGGAELSRLKINAPDGVALFDHKTTASIGRYAKGPAQLAADLQCNLYALATMIEHGVERMPARWVYYETKTVRRALPVDVTIERAQAIDVVASAAEIARKLDTYARSVDAPQNVNACGDYGGCPYHVTAGGPCDARRPIGRLIALRKDKSMALTEEQKAKFAAFRKTAPPGASNGEGSPGEPEAGTVGPAPAPVHTAPTTRPAEGPAQLTLPHVAAPAPAPEAGTETRPRGRPRKLAVVPPPAPIVVTAGGVAEIVGRAHAEIAQAEQAMAEALARRDEAIAELRAALG